MGDSQSRAPVPLLALPVGRWFGKKTFYLNHQAMIGTARGKPDDHMAFVWVEVIRLERTKARYGEDALRCVLQGIERKMKIDAPVRAIDRPFVEAPSARAASFVDFIEEAVRRILAASPDVTLVIGLGKADWWAWTIVGIACVAALLGVLIAGVSGAPPFAALPAAGFIAASMVPCWINIRHGMQRTVTFEAFVEGLTGRCPDSRSRRSGTAATDAARIAEGSDDA